MSDHSFTETTLPGPARAARGGSGAMLAALVAAFLLGGAGVGYAAWEGLIPLHRGTSAERQAVRMQPESQPATIAGGDQGALAAQQATLEARTAALAQRLQELSAKADAASGNASRAEALLVAFAARRALDRGAQLGYLEDQLKLRFGNTQPNAVATVIEAARRPVTMDQLIAGLDSRSADLTQIASEGGAWSRIRREFAQLFVIRHESTPDPAPRVLLQNARVMLEAGRTEDALSLVQRLPGARDAGDWLAAARRYDAARRALDVLETSALLDDHLAAQPTVSQSGAEAAVSAPVTPPAPPSPVPGDGSAAAPAPAT